MLQPKLIKLLQLAYSAEMAAAYAYQGHSKSIASQKDKNAIRQIEQDEWEHRNEVLQIMKEYKVDVSKWMELKYTIIGKFISWSCHVIGYFLPIYFAGRLESGNVNEYFIMKDWFNELGIYKHDDLLVEMGIKEKEHEIYFAQLIANHWMLPYFERVFGWGPDLSYNNIELSEELNQKKEFTRNEIVV